MRAISRVVEGVGRIEEDMVKILEYVSTSFLLTTDRFSLDRMKDQHD
jgi:hypothetical protein